jgi:hypothetical protein
MKDIRFYQEFENKSKTRPTGNVVAIEVGNTGNGFTSYGAYIRNGQVLFEALSAIFDYADSAVAYGAVAQDYLRERCKKISEAKARAIHPALFERLDA